MIDFLLAYWRILVVTCLIIINIIISLVRKPKVLNTVIDTINEYVPTAINAAERAIGSGNGSAKLNYAIDYVLNYLQFRFNINYNVVQRYKKYIALEIETVLSTPHKKEEI